jgi:hypothetical protein
VSGTLGLTGVVDSILILKREPGGVALYGRGRDLEEIEKAMEFERYACIWRITGDAVDVRRSKERTAVLNAIKEAAEPVGPAYIASATRMKAVNVRFLLHQLLQEGAIEKTSYGKYRIVPAADEATEAA